MPERERITRLLEDIYAKWVGSNTPEPAWNLMADALLAAREGADCNAEARLPSVPSDISCESERYYRELFGGGESPSYHALTHMYIGLAAQLATAQARITELGAIATSSVVWPFSERALKAEAQLTLCIADGQRMAGQLEAAETRIEALGRWQHVLATTWQVNRDEMVAAHGRALEAAEARVLALETRLHEIQHKDRWCICPFSVVEYPHMVSCPLGIAADLLALLQAEGPRAPGGATT